MPICKDKKNEFKVVKRVTGGKNSTKGTHMYTCLP